MNRVGTRTMLLGSILVLVIMASIGWGTNAKLSTKNQWEYKVVVVGDPNSNTSSFVATTERELNSLGTEGWELVYFIPDKQNLSHLYGTWIYKRPK